MAKKYSYLISILIMATVLGFWLLKPRLEVGLPGCVNKDYKIPLNLQSGEKGTLHLTDNHCELSSKATNANLSFKVLNDGAIEDSLYQSRLYVWSRDTKLTSEEQIKLVVKEYNQKAACLLQKDDYPQHDGLVSYSLKSSTGSNSDCLLFSPSSDLASEIFIENNNLLILQRQDGIEGIEPFNLASLRFIRE